MQVPAPSVVSHPSAAPARVAPIELVLARLRDYLQGCHPEQARPLPLAFWQLEEDALFDDALGLLPLFMHDLGEDERSTLPEAFRLAFPLFWIEAVCRYDSWHALSRAGERMLPQAIAAYARLGMADEARGFEAALRALRAGPPDEQAVEAAYRAVPRRHADEQARQQAVSRFFRTNPGLWAEHTEAANA